jgi:hypothetical protein
LLRWPSSRASNNDAAANAMLVASNDLAGCSVGVVVTAAGSAFGGTAVAIVVGALVGANVRVLAGSAREGFGAAVEVIRD